jgi:hypothetical protein
VLRIEIEGLWAVLEVHLPMNIVSLSSRDCNGRLVPTAETEKEAAEAQNQISLT